MDAYPQSLLLIGATLENALDLAKNILGPTHEKKIDLGHHPDIHHYVPEEKSGQHPIANIRRIIEETALPPSEASCKIFIIEEGEKMLPSSSNALLKTLEEPREGIYFFLLTHHPKQLLATIRSRLYPLSFTKLVEEEVSDVSALIAKAKNDEWDLVLEELPDKELDSFLQGLMSWAEHTQNPRLFQKALTLAAQAQRAQEHHVKDRNIILNLLINI